MPNFKAIAVAASLFALPGLGAPAGAVPFTPVIDEFFVVKNGTEIFRDSFSDGALPASGPDDGVTPSGDTYSVSGGAGFTSETGGKLTMTPALGSQTLITGSTADTFTGARRLRSTNPASGAFLGFGDAFEIHGLFDMSSIPSVSGQSFGIRASDNSGTTDGKDVFQLVVGKSSSTGNIVVASRELDFGADTSELVDAISMQSFLPSAEQIELIISKQAGSDLVSASFNLFGAGATLLTLGTLDNINNVTGLEARIYTDQDFTRPQFFATDTDVPVPEPGTLPVFGLALFGLACLRRGRAT